MEVPELHRQSRVHLWVVLAVAVEGVIQRLEVRPMEVVRVRLEIQMELLEL
jgi:hypothetical protein